MDMHVSFEHEGDKPTLTSDEPVIPTVGARSAIKATLAR